jgi:hypothetical protein
VLAREFAGLSRLVALDQAQHVAQTLLQLFQPARFHSKPPVFAIKKMHFGQLHATTPCKAYTFFFADDALLGANASEMDARHLPQRENAVAGP